MRPKASWLVAATLGLGVALLLVERQPRFHRLSTRLDRWGLLGPACQVGPVLFEVGLWLLERSNPVYGRAARAMVDLARRGRLWGDS